MDDLTAGAEFLEREYSAPALLVGHSFGGVSSVRAARRIASMRAVAVVNSPNDPKHITSYFPDRLAEIREQGSAMVPIAGRPFPIGRDFLEDLAQDDAEAALRELGKPLLICHAPDDDVVPIEKARQTFQMAQYPKSFVSLDTADHFLSKREDADYAAGVIAAWFARY